MRSRCLAVWGGLLLTGLALSGVGASSPHGNAAQRGAAHPPDVATVRPPSDGRFQFQTAPGGNRPTRDPHIRDLDGRTLHPFDPPGRAGVIFFLTSDCPVSNGYAQEIQRVCRDYGSQDVGCSLMYEDVELPASATRLDDDVRANLRDYGYAGVPAAVDRQRAIATHAKVSVTPTAVVVDAAGAIRYRGRIDNFYAALGRPRQQVTERDLRAALDAVLAGRPVPRPETQAVGCFIVDPSLLRK